MGLIMKNPAICKSECNTWYVIAFVDRYGDYGVVFEANRKKDCIQYLEDHKEEIVA